MSKGVAVRVKSQDLPFGVDHDFLSMMNRNELSLGEEYYAEKVLNILSL